MEHSETFFVLTFMPTFITLLLRSISCNIPFGHITTRSSIPNTFSIYSPRSKSCCPFYSLLRQVFRYIYCIKVSYTRIYLPFTTPFSYLLIWCILTLLHKYKQYKKFLIKLGDLTNGNSFTRSTSQRN